MCWRENTSVDGWYNSEKEIHQETSWEKKTIQYIHEKKCFAVLMRIAIKLDAAKFHPRAQKISL